MRIRTQHGHFKMLSRPLATMLFHCIIQHNRIQMTCLHNVDMTMRGVSPKMRLLQVHWADGARGNEYCSRAALRRLGDFQKAPTAMPVTLARGDGQIRVAGQSHEASLWLAVGRIFPRLDSLLQGHTPPHRVPLRSRRARYSPFVEASDAINLPRCPYRLERPT